MKWNIKIDKPSLGGYAPGYFNDDYPNYGNGNMAGRMLNADLTSPSALKPGKGLSAISSTSDLMRGVYPTVITADTTYATGLDAQYKITATSSTVGNTITGATGEDVAFYGGDVFFSYNKAANAGDIAKLVLPTTYTDDWWTGAGGTALKTDMPHPMVVAGTSGVLWIADGQYLKEWDGTTATDDAFDTQDEDSVIVDVEWNRNVVWIGANKPNVSGKKEGVIYVWDGTAPSWSSKAKIEGEIGALFVLNGTTYVIYKEDYDNDVCSVGYVDGETIHSVANYQGSLPEYYETTNYKGFIVWKSGTDLWAFGAGDNNINARVFQLCQVEAGSISNPFGDLLTFSANEMKKLSGYTTSSNWKSLLFESDATFRKSIVDDVYVKVNPMLANARMDLSLVDNAGNTLHTEEVSNSKQGTQTNIRIQTQCQADNFRVEIDNTNGNTTNPVEVRSILIKGHSQV